MTENIVKFLQANYSDEKLAALLAHAQDGKLAFYSCCCIDGAATADHALRGVMSPGTIDLEPHYVAAKRLPFADAAESEFCNLADESCTSEQQLDAMRRKNILPLIIAEQERRAKLKAEPDALLVAASVAQ